MFRIRPGAQGFYIHALREFIAVEGTYLYGNFTRPDCATIEEGFLDSPTSHFGELENHIADWGGIAQFLQSGKDLHALCLDSLILK